MLSRDGIRFVEIIDSLGLEGLETCYTFMDAEGFRELLERDVSAGMRVYWSRNVAARAPCRRNSHFEEQALALRSAARYGRRELAAVCIGLS